MMSFEPSREVHARALKALRPLLLGLGLPATALFVAVEIEQGRTSAWLLGQALATVVMSLALVRERALERRAVLFSVSLAAFAAFAFMHFGSQVGAGLFFCAAAVSATFFHGRSGAAVTVTTLTLTVALGTLGHHYGLVALPHLEPPEPLVGARMVVSTGVALTMLTVMFVRVQVALRTARTSEIDARAEQQLAELERERALELAMQAQRLEAAGRLASGVAHDFNNALMVLQGTVELLGLEPDPSKREALVAEGIAAVEGATVTTRQLLDFARPGGETEGQCEPGPILERLQRSMRRVLPESITLTASVGACPPVPLPRGILEQVLLNLLINGRDAIDGQGSIEMRCATNPAGDAIVEVVDSGEGMDEATHRRAFEPFFTTKGEHGTGLGLAMVRNFVTHSGGTIELDSAPGRGTRFVLRWPVRPESSAADEPLDLASPRTHEPSRSPTPILLVEDNREVARVLARSLARAGYAVTQVHSVAEAERAIDRQRFALVCSDGVLPDGTARDVQRAWVAADPEHAAGRMLLCTGYADRPELIDAVEHGAVLLHKPFAATTLLAQVDALIHDPPGR